MLCFRGAWDFLRVFVVVVFCFGFFFEERFLTDKYHECYCDTETLLLKTGLFFSLFPFLSLFPLGCTLTDTSTFLTKPPRGRHLRDVCRFTPWLCACWQVVGNPFDFSVSFFFQTRRLVH